MPQVVSAKEFLDLSFPLKGNDASNEFWRQADLTTVKGVNVRGEEPVGQNVRGGQRSGLSRFVDDLVAGPGDVIQMLNVVVDPQAAGLDADTDEQIPGYIPDPSTNNLSDRGSTGRFVPPGGSGRPPNRNIPHQASSGLVQHSFAYIPQDATPSDLSAGTAEYTIDLSQAPAFGNLIVVFVTTNTYRRLPDRPQPTGPTVVGTVRNNSTNNYTQLAGGSLSESYTYTDPGDFSTKTGYHTAQAYYYYAAAGAADAKIRVTLTSPPSATDGFVGTDCNVEYYEFSGYAGAPVDAKKSSGTGAAWTCGAMALPNTAGQLAIVLINGQENPYTAGVSFTGPSGYTGGLNLDPTASGKSYWTNTLSGVTTTPTVTGGSADYYAIGATFKKP